MHAIMAGEAPGTGELKRASKKSRKKMKKKKTKKTAVVGCNALSEALVRCAMADGDHLSLGDHPAICEEGHIRGHGYVLLA